MDSEEFPYVSDPSGQQMQRVCFFLANGILVGTYFYSIGRLMETHIYYTFMYLGYSLNSKEGVQY